MSVLVYTENWDGKFKKLSYELVSYASELADKTNTEAIALSVGSVSDEEIIKKVHLLREFDPLMENVNNIEDVPDPYYGGDGGFENVYQMVFRCCDHLINQLIKK